MMRHHTHALRWVTVPAALAAVTMGVAGPVQAAPGHSDGSHAGSGQGRADHAKAGHAKAGHAKPEHTSPGHAKAGHASTGPASTDPASTNHAKADHAKTESSLAASTFDKPNHWQAQADPDGMTNGGVDQPGGTGGTIGYQDGNNGSGNDIDCEDDNRGRGVPGHCKVKAMSPKPQSRAHTKDQPEKSGAPTVGQTPRPATLASRPAPAASHHPVVKPVHPPAEVLGISAVRPRTQPHLGVTGQVAGVSAQAGPTLGVLPNTGAPGALAPLGAAGAALATGGGLVLLRRRRTID